MVSNFPIASSLGLIHISWATFEMTLEVLCHKILNTTHRQTCIIFSSLNFKAKQEITISLVREGDLKNKEEIISCIRRVASVASRNHLFHSVIFTNTKHTNIEYLKRDIQNGLNVKEKSFNNESMKDHLIAIADESKKLQDLCGITDEEFETYGDLIKSYKE